MNFNKTLVTDAIRTIERTKSRFISIIGIIALGISFFSGMAATAPDMVDTAEQYYINSNLMDINIISGVGLTDKELLELKNCTGVEDVVGQKFVDGILSINGVSETDIDGTKLTVRAISLDINKAIFHTNSGEDDPTYMNRVQLIDGTWPTSSNQCLVDESMLSTPENFKIGATIKVESDKDDLTKSLANTEYTIVGIIRTPLYISYDRGNTTIGTGKLGTFFYAPSDNFLSDYYSSAGVRLVGSDEYEPYSEEYQTFVDGYIGEIETKAKEVIELRATSLIDTFTKEIETNEAEYIKQKTNAESELANAKETMDQVLEMAYHGDAQLSIYKAEYNDKAQMASDSLADSKAQHTEQYQKWEASMENYNKLNALVKQYSTAENDLANAKVEFNVANSQVNATLTTVSYFEQLIATTRSAMTSFDGTQQGAIDSMLDRFQTAGLVGVEVDNLMNTINSLTAVGTAEEMAAYLEPQLQNLESNLSASKAELTEAKAQLEVKSTELAKAEELVNTLKQLETKLDGADVELKNAEKELADAGYDIQFGELEVLTQLSDLKNQIATYETNLALAKDKAPTIEADYKEAEQKAVEALTKAKNELDNAKVELEGLSTVKYYVQNRDDGVSGYEEYRQTTERTKNLATIFPWFFLIVAALMCLNTMTRMIEEDRTQLGTLKALGYENKEIMSKYILYALLASSVGSIAGTFVGFALFPTAIDTAYGILYDLPTIQIVYRFSYAIPSILLAVGATVLATFIACRQSLSVLPSKLMRPKPPKLGKRVFLERIPQLWSRLNFTAKVTLRNVFRNKKRFIMAVVGVAGCTALIVAGFGLGDAIDASITNQFVIEDRINKYDLQIVLANSQDLTKGESEALKSIKGNPSIQPDECILNYMKIYQSTNDEQSKYMEVYLSVPQDPTKLSTFVKLEERIGSDSFELGNVFVDNAGTEGVIITEKLAKQLDLKVHDNISIDLDNGSVMKVPIGAIVENYTFHFIYMSPTMYEKYFGEPVKYNYVTANLVADFTDTQRGDLAANLMQDSNVSAVAYTSDIQSSFQNIISSLNYLVLILLVSAGLLSFIVLFNLSNININERLREIASIKVLGFNNLEVSNYIFRENAILSVIGTFFGLFIGSFLNLAVINIAEVDIVMFGREIEPTSYLYATLLSFAFSIIVNVALHGKLKKVDMVESLKSVE